MVMWAYLSFVRVPAGCDRLSSTAAGDRRHERIHFCGSPYRNASFRVRLPDGTGDGQGDCVGVQTRPDWFFRPGYYTSSVLDDASAGGFRIPSAGGRGEGDFNSRPRVYFPPL